MHLLLWMMDEAGEVGDVIRKQGLEEPEVRRHFVEEMCDVMMYFTALMTCLAFRPTNWRNSTAPSTAET